MRPRIPALPQRGVWDGDPECCPCGSRPQCSCKRHPRAPGGPAPGRPASAQATLRGVLSGRWERGSLPFRPDRRKPPQPGQTTPQGDEHNLRESALRTRTDELGCSEPNSGKVCDPFWMSQNFQTQVLHCEHPLDAPATAAGSKCRVPTDGKAQYCWSLRIFTPLNICSET